MKLALQIFKKSADGFGFMTDPVDIADDVVGEE